jgi:hypothetical protein
MSPQQGSIDMTKHIAENIFKDLRSFGLQDKDIVAVSSEILNHLTMDIRTRASVSAQGQSVR